MKTGGAMLIIAVGLVALWIVVTGRLTQLEGAWNVLSGNAAAPTTGTPLVGGSGGSGINYGQIGTDIVNWITGGGASGATAPTNPGTSQKPPILYQGPMPGGTSPFGPIPLG